ncbi:hypothetical protein QYF61_013286 [Mycteria americana]|uniref:Integrase catalytic domain-containing protein n=1 Tax=Mycteria americana TaxID=33587 RepID=A0AAN7NHI9_MYCAM|nr:hypothetical protein QYF61_013286 [Mycteria americana]
MDTIAQVIHECETCAAIKQTKRLKPLWYGGQCLKYKYGEAWQIDYTTLPQTRQGKCYVLTMVEATTGWLETYPVPHATARKTILGLEKEVLWQHGTPERIESDNSLLCWSALSQTTHSKLLLPWAKANPFVGLLLLKDLGALEAPPALLIGSALACGGSVLEPAETGSVRHKAAPTSSQRPPLETPTTKTLPHTSNTVVESNRVSRILKVAKPNIVVMKLLAGGHKKDSKMPTKVHSFWQWLSGEWKP